MTCFVTGKAPLQAGQGFASGADMSNFVPETIRVRDTRVTCDGSSDIPAALGHPKVWLQIDESGFVDCGYCDRRFVLIGGVADKAKTD